MSERVLNQAIYSLIKELEVWTGRKVKGGEGYKCKHGEKCECGAKCKCECEAKYECKHEARAHSEIHKVFSVHSLLICMYRWYKYKGYVRYRCCGVSTIDHVISRKTNGVHKRGSWSGDGLWDNGDISCGLLIAQWDNAHDLMSLPMPGHTKPKRVMWGMKGAVKWGACVLHLRPMTTMIKCL